MGLLTGLLTLPLAPVRGTMWVAERLLEEVERELDDPRNIEAQLLEAEARFERGEITSEEYELLEDALMRRLTPGGW
jgi:Gas vesicle protein G